MRTETDDWILEERNPFQEVEDISRSRGRLLTQRLSASEDSTASVLPPVLTGRVDLVIGIEVAKLRCRGWLPL